MKPSVSVADPAAATERTPRILVVDDELGIRDLLTRELTVQGYWVEAVADGVEALGKIQEKNYQVVLCDINMPRLGGLELLEKMRHHTPDVEVIMMTGYATVEMAVKAMQEGAYDFVQKPFHLNELLALVEKCLEKSEMKTVIQELRAAKKKLEEMQTQLIQSEKLAGVGQLAAGVAHELNNPLSGVMGFAQLLLEDNSLQPQQRKDIETIYSQSQRCRNIIQNLLQFSRRKDPKKEAVDLLPLMHNTIELVRYEFSTSGVDLVQKLPASLPLVFGDSHQLQQVFINLITNARQAMEGRRKSRLLIEAGAADGNVFLDFKDNGPGIPAEIRGKIFDPFFTTKPVGQGTGLGLSICYGIVQDHQGTLRFESVVGEGTTFTLELPRYE